MGIEPGRPGQQPLATSPCIIRRLGIQPYTDIWHSMQEFTRSRSADTPDELWVLQHTPVFTQGQAGKAEHVLDAHDIPVVPTDRGGQVTYHGPGQLVVYLLIDVRRNQLGVRQLVDLIEHKLIAVLAAYNIKAQTRQRAPGVYVGDRKIAALGLRIKQGCSYHGLSFNIDMDLTPFSYINPCGYAGLGVTQLADLLSHRPDDLFTDAQEKVLSALQAGLVQFPAVSG